MSVTGLSTVDTADHWTFFGQAVILLLIQTGGLGIMTLASLIGLAVARRLSLGSKLSTSAETQGVGLADIRRFIIGAIVVSLGVEAIGAIVLAVWFATASGYPLPIAAWYGLFHAVSAFNNAGFTILPRGLVPFVGDPVVCLVLSVLVLIGSLGFPVLDELRRFPRRPLRWSMNTRLVLWGTVVLTLAGTRVHHRGRVGEDAAPSARSTGPRSCWRASSRRRRPAAAASRPSTSGSSTARRSS